MAACDVSRITSSPNYDETRDFASVWYDMCVVLVKFDYDWALFVEQMLHAAAVDYGDAAFVNQTARPEGRIAPLSDTDLIVLSGLTPNSRVRTTGNAVYLGYDADDGSEKLYAVPLSAAWVVEDSGSHWRFGTEDRANQSLQAYAAPTSSDFSWDDWEAFHLFSSELDGGVVVDNEREKIGAAWRGELRPPFGGSNSASVVQVAATSSAAGGNGSPRAPSFYAQVFSIGRHGIDTKRVKTVWRVLAGIAAGVGTGLVIGFGFRYFNSSFYRLCKERPARKWAIGLGSFFGVAFGLTTGFVYGIGSIVVPNKYNDFVSKVYGNSSFDNFAVCSQWPNPCGERDAFLVDGWFIDNPALVSNVAHYQKRRGNATALSGSALKVIVTNCNEEWNTTFNRAQILNYFSTYFNQGVQPGDFLWAPGYWAPYRSPQIFSDYLDEAGLDALLEPIPESNITTAILRGVTLDNPSFGVAGGLSVEMLLINLNEDITTYVIGKSVIENFTEPLARMTSHIATNEVLIQRIGEFVGKPSRTQKQQTM
ncbi:hypothetical protein ACHAWF_012202 [Thalassiosira exigua]